MTQHVDAHDWSIHGAGRAELCGSHDHALALLLLLLRLGGAGAHLALLACNLRTCVRACGSAPVSAGSGLWLLAVINHQHARSRLAPGLLESAE